MTSAALLLAAVTIAFPREGDRLPALETCYVIGATDGAETNLVVQGRNVPVYRTGAWATMVDLRPGRNDIRVGDCCRTIYVADRNGKVDAPAKPPVYRKLPYAKDTPRTPPVGKKPGDIVIALDPGHGGRNGGAVSPHGLDEADVNWRLTQQVAAELKRRGFKVVLTRGEHEDRGLYDRPKVAHAAEADAFVSIHHNAPGYAQDPSKCRYSSVYCWNDAGRRLATAIDRQMVAAQGETLKSVGVKHANFVVIRNPEIPSCLVEADFITSPEGEAASWNPVRRQRTAVAIAEGIADWCRQGK